MSNSLMTYIAILVLFYAALLRLRELTISKRNHAVLKSEGYNRKDSRISYLNMISLHTSFFVVALLEISFLNLHSNKGVQFFALIVFIFSQIVRYAALKSLGTFWNTNIMSNPARAAFIQSGPYKFIRHPNYLAVILEFISIPLIAGAWRTALAYSLWNAIVLKERISSEETELFKISGYEKSMGPKKRFIPGVI